MAVVNSVSPRPKQATGAGLVFELQSDALNRNVSVSDLLRKALAVSKKLSVAHIEGWLSSELNGYTDATSVPIYRKIRGQIRVWNPYHGWQPLNFEDPKEAELFSQVNLRQAIGELDALVQKPTDHLTIPLPQEVVNGLMAGMEVPLQPAFHVAAIEVIGILDAVRNSVLEFSLKLEQEGIHGEGMSFSREEKQAAGLMTYNITNNIGSMHGSQIQQHSSGNQTLNVNADLRDIAAFVSTLRASIDKLGLDQDSRKELLAEIATTHSQAESPRPKRAVIEESMRTIRTILEGAAGSVLATGFLAELGKLLS